MYLNGEDVTDAIRLPEVSRYASDVSAHPAVRDYLLEMQRQLAREHSVIMDGRDIGTVVLPDAAVKVFLTASAEARAERRVLELEQRGTPQPYAQVLEEIRQRDYNDTHRAAAPLRQAEDAVVLDTTDLIFRRARRRCCASYRRIWRSEEKAPQPSVPRCVLCGGLSAGYPPSRPGGGVGGPA
jgi:cytidylate kinase